MPPASDRDTPRMDIVSTADEIVARTLADLAASGERPGPEGVTFYDAKVAHQHHDLVQGDDWTSRRIPRRAILDQQRWAKLLEHAPSWLHPMPERDQAGHWWIEVDYATYSNQFGLVNYVPGGTSTRPVTVIIDDEAAEGDRS